MFCIICGKKIDDDARFCEHCGMPVFTNLTEEKLKKLHEQRAAGKAQPRPEAEKPVEKQTLTCPACGMELPIGANFCDRCGNVIAG